jgi:DNA-directed RNA polymerase subunit H (RpoH/RPB5)
MAEIGNVIMNNKEKITTCVTNILKLFNRRDYFDTDNSDKIDSIVKEINENNRANIKSKDMVIIIYYNDSELKNISSGSDVDDLLSKNLEHKKFIIVKEMSKKVYKQVQEYKNGEIFQIHELLEDIPSKSFIPEHQLLTNDEKTELGKYYEYENLPKIFNTEMMSRYYGAKVGDIFKITRMQLNSGLSTYYRIVVNDASIYFL